MEPGAHQETGTGSRKTVARNALIMMMAQVIGLPFSLLVNVLMGRMLGPGDYGRYYVLMTYALLIFLFVDWGLGSVLPAQIANDRSRSGLYFGSALCWKALAGCVATVLMAGFFMVRGESRPVLLVLVFICLSQVFLLLTKTAADAVRGFEQTGMAALSQAGTQVLTALLVIPVLFMHGTLTDCAAAIAVAALLIMLVVWRVTQRMPVGKPIVQGDTVKAMLYAGTSFLIFNLVLYLQPAVDAYFLNAYASPDAVGWMAAARKLTNPLIFPVTAMTAALYPTLSRLSRQQPLEYRNTIRSALRASIAITMPLSVGCAAFSELGMLLYSRESFAQVEQNLRIQAVQVFLLYFSMILGVGLNAAGQQRKWAAVQLLCVVVSLSGDPWLIPWFQAHMGNGGLGVNVTSVCSEVLMVGAAIWLLPQGIVDRSVLITLAKALLAGLVMFAVATELHSAGLLVAIPVATATYGLALLGLRGFDARELRAMFTRRQQSGSTSPA